MVKTETVIINEKAFCHTYSDAGRYLVQDGTGSIYEEAYDPGGIARTYTEGELIPISDEDYAAAGRILMGGEA